MYLLNGQAGEESIHFQHWLVLQHLGSELLQCVAL
jgi:hypothetical protein